MLRAHDLTVRFGGLTAVDGVDLEVRPGEIVALLGPNGAGKSTVINALTRLVPLAGGSATFEGTDLMRLPGHGLAAIGVTRTFQNLQLFSEMTPRENVLVALHRRDRSRPWTHALRLPAARRSERELRLRADRALARVSFPPESRDEPVEQLPFGRQKLVELARAFVMDPRVILLDEPVAGLTAGEQRETARVIEDLRDGTLAILLVEHNMPFVLLIADRLAVMNFGRKIADGAPAEVRRDPAVLEAYLGDPDAEH